MSYEEKYSKWENKIKEIAKSELLHPQLETLDMGDNKSEVVLNKKIKYSEIIDTIFNLYSKAAKERFDFGVCFSLECLWANFKDSSRDFEKVLNEEEYFENSKAMSDLYRVYRAAKIKDDEKARKLIYIKDNLESLIENKLAPVITSNRKRVDDLMSYVIHTLVFKSKDILNMLSAEEREQLSSPVSDEEILETTMAGIQLSSIAGGDPGTHAAEMLKGEEKAVFLGDGTKTIEDVYGWLPEYPKSEIYTKFEKLPEEIRNISTLEEALEYFRKKILE
jgi:hypothetical protein